MYSSGMWRRVRLVRSDVPEGSDTSSEEATCPSEPSVLTGPIRRHIQEDGILQNYSHGNLKSYTKGYTKRNFLKTGICVPLFYGPENINIGDKLYLHRGNKMHFEEWRNIPEDYFLNSHRSENLKSYKDAFLF
jgi:hypothetical protein